MPDPIEILPEAAHPNVPAVKAPTSYTTMLAHYEGGHIERKHQRKGEIVDVSGYALLRVALNLTDTTNRNGSELGTGNPAALHAAIEHHDGHGWKLLHQFDPMSEIGSQPVALSSFFGLIRASWWYARPGDPIRTVSDEVAMTFSITGDALPSAESE
jgi:hypothetical protein